MALVICYKNDVDAASVSASSSISSLPPTNVKDFDIQKIWRASANSADFFWDAGSALPLGAVAAINCNATLGDTFQVRASLTDPTVVSALSYNSGTLAGINPVFGKFVHVLPAAVSYRYGRITFNQSTPPEAGRITAGEAWRPTRNMLLSDSPPEALADDPSRRSLSIGQNVYIDELEPRRGYRFTVRGIPDAEKYAQVDELNRLCGTHKDILVCVNDASNDLGRDSIWGLMEAPVTARRIVDFPGFWEIGFEIWERL